MTVWGALLGLVLGCIIGAASCMVGIGGGVLLIPSLVFLYGMSQKTAQGTSVATLLWPIGLLAFWQYRKAGHVNLPLAIIIAAGFVVGGWFGGRWAQQIPDVVLRRVFAGVLALLAVKLALTR